MKLSFKKEPRETGLRAVGRPYQGVHIKCDGRIVGYIRPPAWDTKDHCWSVGIAVKHDEPGNCDWIWVFFKARHSDEPTARAWIKSHWSSITRRYTFHSLENRGGKNAGKQKEYAMSAQSHSRLLDLAKEAVRAVASDQSICPETTKESLREIADECEMRIDAINADLEREVH